MTIESRAMCKAALPLRRPALLLAVACLTLVSLATLPAAAQPDLEPPSTGSLWEIDHALLRLGQHTRLLMIAAHPDDEDTTLLTWVARGLGGEAAYLSLSRGDGGQNLLGPELGEGLGLLRSRELEAARRVDGARQFFSPAYDFGFTRSLDETFERWGEESLLEDSVRVVRLFKPQILMSVFPPTPQAGHGQHQAAGVIAERLLKAAADPDAFPHLLDEGLAPWSIQTFYRSAFFSSEEPDVTFPLGTVDPSTGRSILQIALESRSQHRCQDMGMLQPLGDLDGRLDHVAGQEEDELFGATDNRLAALADLLDEDTLRQRTAERLETVADLAQRTRETLTLQNVGEARINLGEIVRQLRAVHDDLTTAHNEAPKTVGIVHARELVSEKLQIAQQAFVQAARVGLDAVTDRAQIVPSERLDVQAILWNAGPGQLEDLRLEVVSVDGWTLVDTGPVPEERRRFNPKVTEERQLTVELPFKADPTVPYFLRKPRDGDRYDWSTASAEDWGQPFEPPPLFVRFHFTLDGIPITLEREVLQRVRDQARGEVRTPLRAVPALEITVEPDLVVASTAEPRTETLRITLASHAAEPLTVRLELEAPAGGPGHDLSLPEDLTIRPGGTTAVEVPMPLTSDLQPGRYPLRLTAVTENGARYTMAYPTIEYPHVRPTTWPRAAEVEVQVGDIRLPKIGRIGYVRGASDRVPETLGRLGLQVELLDDTTLASGDLSSYDALVIGSRAYEVRPALVTANPRLLDYTRDGGLLLVQYQQYQFVNGDLAPFPLDIRRPHDRITDETAPVRALVPEHRIFHHPNTLEDGDWHGWVQERGLYFAGTWDDVYQPLLALADPGGEEKQGGLLVAPLGSGTYVYTGLAFFRQLPAGVTGAYRLFANLLALASNSEEASP